MGDLITLHSGEFSASIHLLGAELCSLKHLPSDTEFIWQADKKVWARHSPILFPFVGRLKNFEYSYDGQTYMMEQHGFARDLLFSLRDSNENSAEFELTDNDHTWQRYPFRFRFILRYTLEQNILSMEFELINMGESVMPVSFGGHPAFTINEPGDCILIFENDNDPYSWGLRDSFISNELRKVTDGVGKIHLNPHSFDNDAMVFKDLRSKWIKIVSKTSKKSVTVNIENWPYLGIWAKPGASFVCIEPWQGIADSIDFKDEVSQKEGIIMIPPDGTFKKSFSIEVSV